MQEDILALEYSRKSPMIQGCWFTNYIKKQRKTVMCLSLNVFNVLEIIVLAINGYSREGEDMDIIHTTINAILKIEDKYLIIFAIIGALIVWISGTIIAMRKEDKL